ncbi:MAG: 2-oxoglutarate ferredoxin oxidoreductase subunit gamma [Deltaproteobacteria bacterium HGW-Deltaproteobacteria-21]|nr:MAG: 2-oxoglutarate ferredoxin oxidoreductase subunit gamma [Deltaproteobacteria bacterium HGW-Deltaproteobacteria-21]
MERERYRLVFSGSGGQGVITAAIILAEAAVIYEGLNAVQSQSYGPEARGGATRADVIISNRDIRFPKVTQPNVLVCLTQEAYNKFSATIRPGGLLLSDSQFVKPERKVDARQLGLPMHETVMDRLGKSIVYNICVLGATLGLTRLVSTESIMKVLGKRVPPDLLELNKAAFEIGLELAEGSEKPEFRGQRSEVSQQRNP